MLGLAPRSLLSLSLRNFAVFSLCLKPARIPLDSTLCGDTLVAGLTLTCRIHADSARTLLQRPTPSQCAQQDPEGRGLL